VPEPRPLTWLLSEAARAAFFGRPADALVALGQVRQRADGTVAGQRARWLGGVVLTAAGRYDAARGDLAPLLDVASAPSLDPHLQALACAVGGSIERQLGRHARGGEFDSRGLELVAGLGDQGLEARLDCAIGFAADAVGLGQLPAAGERLAVVTELLDKHGPAAGWRAHCRAHWVRAEISLLGDRPDLAQEAAARAVRIAAAAGAPRHRAKSLLFLGVSQAGAASAGTTEPALSTLREAAGLAEALGLRPLVWPCWQVLARLLTDPAAAERARARAGQVLREVAAELPPEEGKTWLDRPEVAEITAG
jgi:hypothetical protein